MRVFAGALGALALACAGITADADEDALQPAQKPKLPTSHVLVPS